MTLRENMALLHGASLVIGSNPQLATDLWFKCDPWFRCLVTVGVTLYAVVVVGVLVWAVYF